MQLAVLLAFLLHLITFIAAAPAATEAVTHGHDLRVGLPGALYVCEGENFTGDCFWNPPERMRACAIMLIGNPDSGVGHKPLSLGPDRGGHCDVFKGKTCNDQTFYKRIDWPGVKNVAELSPAEWDIIRCYGTAA